MGTQREQMTGILSWLVHWACRYKGLLFCLDCSSRPSTKYFFPRPYTFFNSVSPSPSNLGSGQATVLGRLSLIVFLCGISRFQSPSMVAFFNNHYCFFLDKCATMTEKLLFFLSIFFGSLSQFQHFILSKVFAL
jgi:hypothetical protein